MGYGPFTQDYQTSYFISNEHRGWPMEAAIGVLNDVAGAQNKVSRVMVMFSEGIGFRGGPSHARTNPWL